MKIKMLTTLAGPEGCISEGATVNLPESEAFALIEAKCAVAVPIRLEEHPAPTPGIIEHVERLEQGIEELKQANEKLALDNDQLKQENEKLAIEKDVAERKVSELQVELENLKAAASEPVDAATNAEEKPEVDAAAAGASDIKNDINTDKPADENQSEAASTEAEDSDKIADKKGGRKAK